MRLSPLADAPATGYVARVPQRWKVFAAIAVAVIFIDQWTKLLAVKHLTPAFAAAKLGHLPESRERAHEALDSIGFFENISLFFSDAAKSPCDTRGARCPNVRVFDGFWSWRYAENPGAAWSLFAKSDEDFRAPFLITVSLLAFCAILYYVRKLPADQKTQLYALSLIGGGAIGNIIDRIRLRYVIDFILWYRGNVAFPTFNVADSAITCGIALIGLSMFSSSRRGGAGRPATTRIEGCGNSGSSFDRSAPERLASRMP
jgi:signal peptidase II